MGARPAFSFSAGSLSASSERPSGGPSRFVVERDLDVPIDGLRVSLAERAGVAAGDAVTLDLGDEDGLERVFTGSVAEVRPRLGGCELFCTGSMLALVDLRSSSLFQNQSAGAVVRSLVSQAGIEAGEISDGIELPRFSVERRQGAHAQLRRLAERLGYVLFCDRQGKVHFRALGPAAQLDSSAGLLGAALSQLGAAGAAQLEFGKHLLGVEAQTQPAVGRSVLCGGESPMSGQGEDKSFWLTATDSDYEDSAGSGPELLVIDPSARTKDMAGRFAAGYLASFDRDTSQLQARVLGMPALDLGDALSTIALPDESMNASGYIKGLRHRFGAREGFVTELSISTERGA